MIFLKGERSDLRRTNSALVTNGIAPLGVPVSESVDDSCWDLYRGCSLGVGEDMKAFPHRVSCKSTVG